MTAEENELLVAEFRETVANYFPSEEALRRASTVTDPKDQALVRLMVTIEEYPDDYTIAMAMQFSKPLTGKERVRKAMIAYHDPATSM